MSFQEKKVLVLGMGETGFSMVKWLSSRGFKVTAADSRAIPPCIEGMKGIFPRVPVFTGAYPAEAFAGIDLIAISPGVPAALPLVRRARKWAGLPSVPRPASAMEIEAEYTITRPKLINNIADQISD